MEFLFVPILFGFFMFALALGKFFGRKGVQDGCKAGEDVPGANSCGACATDANNMKLPIGKGEDGMDNLAKLGNPNRHRPYSDKFDFRPERMN